MTPDRGSSSRLGTCHFSQGHVKDLSVVSRSRERPVTSIMSMVRRPRHRAIIGSRVVGTLARYAYKRYKRSAPKQPNVAPAATAGDNPLTTQHDFKVDYKRRKRTRRLRRRIKRGRRFTRRVVNSFMRATESTKKVAKLALFTRNCPNNQSNYFGCLLHTTDGQFTGDNPQADWREFFIEGSVENRRGWDDMGNPVVGPLYPNVSERGRAMRCVSANMELMIRNTGTYAAIVNVYRVVCKRTYPFGGQNIETMYDQGFVRSGRVTEIDQPVETTPVGMWDAQMRSTDLTSTPFQSFIFTRHWTIYRRTKYQLAPGEEISLMLKETRPKIINMVRVRANSSVKGLTHGYFIDFQGVPIYDMQTVSAPAQISVQKMVRYAFTMMPEKRPSTSFDVQDAP